MKPKDGARSVVTTKEYRENLSSEYAHIRFRYIISRSKMKRQSGQQAVQSEPAAAIGAAAFAVRKHAGSAGATLPQKALSQPGRVSTGLTNPWTEKGTSSALNWGNRIWYAFRIERTEVRPPQLLYCFHHPKSPEPSKTSIMANKNQEKPLRKVLIVEDEGDMCLLLNIMLSGKDLELEHVKSIAAAEEFLQSETPALVLLDNKLPDGFGIDFIPFIKKNNSSVKIIMISGFDGAAKDAALASGADIYLEKPFTKAQLFQSLMDLLKETEPA